ncbi:hypothetical protein GLV98_09280 [Halobacillus litoralis]|uniref:Uncharacterized protein n=1 Tax=Halobacillus litoralis TaxID=45668 RepID=A0A845E348_9BACI|nr:hypothetical protein [Halobacillus litoralis]MYL49680.1 hypothetical protein [Halobacillus litoralis]
MKENWTSRASLALSLKYDYVKIDSTAHYGEVNIIDMEKQQVLIQLFIDLKRNVVRKRGSLNGGGIEENELILEVKGNLAYWDHQTIEKNLG